MTINVANGPQVTISAPGAGLTWAVGDQISFSGSAVDSSGQPIPASRLTWNLVLHHGACPDCHDHFLQTYGGVSSGSFIAPDHEYPSELELSLTATDAQGVSATKSVRLLPKTVTLTLATSPSGLQLGFNSGVANAPFMRKVIAGSTNSLSAPSPQGKRDFRRWSDGGAQSHTIKAPASNTTYTATYR